MDDFKLEIPNEINVKISNQKNGVMLDENCCTCINIMLTNDGKIATSFLGSHNPFIVSQLEKAQKVYFKELRKTLKKDFKEYAEFPFEDEEDEEECGCGDHGCGETCDCGDEECDDDCACGHEHMNDDEEAEHDCGCGSGKNIEEAQTQEEHA